MNADITVVDGSSVSRVYKSSMGGLTRIKPNVTEHLRETADFDTTPETLAMKHSRESKVTQTRIVFKKLKTNETTGKVSPMTTVITHYVEPGVWSLAESDAQVKEAATFATNNASDISKGSI